MKVSKNQSIKQQQILICNLESNDNYKIMKIILENTNANTKLPTKISG